MSQAGDRSATIDFLQAIRTRSRQPGVGLLIDFGPLTKIYPDAAVLLLAEVHRAIAGAISKSQVAAKRAKDRVMEEVLYQIGVYDLLGIECNLDPEADSVIHWRQATGTLSEGAKGGSMLEAHEGRLADGISRGLYAGIVEAMTNTLHHAYVGRLGAELKHKIGKRWWMLSQEKDGMLTVAICDLGVGIPKSLPRSPTYPFADIKALWRKLRLDTSDVSAIKVALKLGETRTGQLGRGKGLHEIVEAANLSGDGGVFISSNRGVFTSSNGKVYATNHTHSIRGTLIHWQVPMATGASDLGE